MTRTEGIQIIEALVDGKTLFEAMGLEFYVVVNTSKEGFSRYQKSRDPDDLRRKLGEKKKIMVEDFKTPRLLTSEEFDQMVEENTSLESKTNNIEVLHKLWKFCG